MFITGFILQLLFIDIKKPLHCLTIAWAGYHIQRIQFVTNGRITGINKFCYPFLGK